MADRYSTSLPKPRAESLISSGVPHRFLSAHRIGKSGVKKGMVRKFLEESAMSSLKFRDENKHRDWYRFFPKFLKEESLVESLSSQSKTRPWLAILGKNMEEAPHVFSPLGLWSVGMEALESPPTHTHTPLLWKDNVLEKHIHSS